MLFFVSLSLILSVGVPVYMYVVYAMHARYKLIDTARPDQLQASEWAQSKSRSQTQAGSRAVKL